MADLAAIRDRLAKLDTLLADPQPGLATWSTAYGEHMHALSGLWTTRLPVQSRVDACEVIQVIRVMHTRGAGLDEADPVRLVTCYYTLDGQKLAEDDPCSKPEAT